ncbi:putative membrane protein YeaQ/YmgE (transglycosylase-associated protein family) [Streptosporangium album]|uniref:Putative membrane protein YeaQ/YmgE (Transglycosylase-associated protein family) n=1 Tax=Streptosporangium album TaxID=47479 RepID=A0A7W7RWC0_9ACTN|nr:GlsB/YeaQ/YmgE family stress response membrane protein [Streptosporangium album]MBB4939365.1 putative membrane protein YeaQ/YmgE (transglycosylase-associated protein family) [Streptosporangium album]
MIGSIVSAIVIGAIVGALARLLIPGRQKLSIGMTLSVGIVAALVGTLIAGLLGFANTPGIDWWEHLLQLVLAVAAVLVVVQMRANKAR